jgi:hypothetical protein
MEKPTEPPTEVTADELGEYLTLRAKLRGYAKKSLQDHPPGSRDHRYVTKHKLFGTAGRYHKELTETPRASGNKRPTPKIAPRKTKPKPRIAS